MHFFIFVLALMQLLNKKLNYFDIKRKKQKIDRCREKKEAFGKRNPIDKALNT